MGQYNLILPKVAKRAANMSRRQRVARERTLAGVTVSRALQAIRKEARLTQGRLADLAGMSQPEVSRLESKTVRRAPDLVTMMRLAEVCGFTLALIAKRKRHLG
jgi:DNA-binding XRE family transcriptional regulator